MELHPRVAVTDGALSLDAVVAAVTRPGAGGIDVFIGTVRDEAEGRPVTLLEYESYDPMALQELSRIAREIERDFDGVVVAAHHRVGALRVGDIAIVCVASAPHRAEAFAACRRLIDEIKARVPIWKRESGPDGEYWVGWRDARCAGHEQHAHP